MALQKETTLPTGAIGNYWRIDSITLAHKMAIAKVSLYISSAGAKATPPARATTPLMSTTVRLPTFDKTVSPYPAAYSYLKTLKPFEGATDV